MQPLLSVLLASILGGYSLHAFTSPVCRPHNAIAVSLRSSSRRGSSLSMRWGLKSDQSTAPKVTEDGKLLRDTVPFELRGFSLPLVVFSIGAALTTFSFAGFFLNDGGGEGALSSLGFVYGIPVFLIGLSLWYAEIKPVPVISDAAGDAAWNELATDTFKKIRSDVTRHRYGDDAHLDSTLDSLGLKLPQKKYPKLLSLTTSRTDEGELAFRLTFQSSETPYKLWAEEDRVARYATFFGPGVTASVDKVDADNRVVAITLTTTSNSSNSSKQKEEEGM